MKRSHAVGIAVLVAAALPAPLASAQTQTLSFYEVNGPTSFYNAAGKVLHLNPPSTVPKVGDTFDETDRLYAGTSTSHAKKWTGSDHLRCTFEPSAKGQCSLQVAVGGSMLIENSFVVNFKSNSWNLKLTEGTGRFAGMHGSLDESDLPNNNASLVFKVS
jgi:hypothetical protein